MHPLYPETHPYQKHTLKVDDVHMLYIEECGNKRGIPVVFLHGGPGGGISSFHRRYFDCDRYRVILFDQRGCGKSTPHANLENNTTKHLLADIEAIREYLKIDKWLVFGGSWGATLGLLYAQAHPERVHGLVLRGIYLCRQKDIDWFYQEGASRIFPDAWEDYKGIIPKAERDNFVKAYYERLTGDNELARMSAAKAWSSWEGHCSTLKLNQTMVDHFSDPYIALAMARIESHYFINGAFIEENQIIENMDKIEDIPGIIVHGRYDMVCPLDNAIALHNKWPEAQLHIIREAGHSALEPGIVDALVRATDYFATKIENY